MSPADLYEKDFYEWTLRNAELLRTGRATEADLEHIAEEIEDMGKRERRELVSRMAVLMSHLLKWAAQPERRSKSWEATIRIQRKEIAALVVESPSLRPYLSANLADAYEHAHVQAVAETSLPESTFPSTCPYTLSSLLDPEYLP